MSEDFGQATITTLEANGTFEGKYGVMHCFWVVLDNGVKGEALAKSTRPPYKVGDLVQYEVNGTTKQGDNKLKVSLPKDGPPARSGAGSSRGGGGGAPASRNASGGGRSAGNSGYNPLGPTIGMAINNAALDFRHSAPADLVADHDRMKKFVWQRASLYLALAQAMEAGKVWEPKVEEDVQY